MLLDRFASSKQTGARASLEGRRQGRRAACQNRSIRESGTRGLDNRLHRCLDTELPLARSDEEEAFPLGFHATV